MTTQSKFTVGSYWRTRNGRKARVLANDVNGNYPTVVAMQSGGYERVVLLTADGRYFYEGNGQDGFDLITPWVDPPAPPPPPRKLYPAVYRDDGVVWVSAQLFESEEQARNHYVFGEFICLGPAVEVPGVDLPGGES